MQNLNITDGFEKVNDDLIYYNIQIQGPEDPEKITEARFRENRTIAIIDNPSDWIVGIVRFYAPSLYIPIFRWGTQAPESHEDPNLTVYFTFGGVTKSANVIYVEQSNDTTPTTGRLIWNITDFIDQVNTAILTAFNLIKVEGGFPTIKAPELVYDANTNLISLFTEASMRTGNGVKFGMSSLLYSYFPSFNVREDTLLIPNKFVYFLQIFSNPINNITYGGVPGYRILQEFPTVSLWNGVEKILFSSSTIPVNEELLQSGTDLRQRVLFDFILSNDQINDRSAINYYNEGGQRWSTMASHWPLKKLDMEVDILFKGGFTLPLRLNKLDTLTAKLEFRRRGSNLPFF